MANKESIGRSISLGKKLSACTLLLLAITVQIQVTLFAEGTYNGLRLNLADLALPFIGIIIALSLLLKKSHWPSFQIKSPYFWLAGLTFILLGSLLNSHLLYGEISHWALINKFIGWLVLCAYFLMGAWFTKNTSKETIITFFKAAILFFLATFLLQTSALFLHYMGVIHHLGIFDFPMVGTMANKNSFIFLFLSFFAISNFMGRDRFWKNISLIFWALLPIAYALTHARAGLVILPAIIIFLWLLKSEIAWKKAILAFSVSLTLILSFNWMGSHNVFGFEAIDGLSPSRNNALLEVTNIIQTPSIELQENKPQGVQYRGDTMRLKVMTSALDAFKNHPLTGSGLGSASYYQQEKWGAFLNIIDCTPLWLLAETGLIGLLAFMGFYCLCLWTLWKNGRNKSYDPLSRQLCRSIFLVMIVFAGMSLFHEILYTRFLWLFMGLAIGFPLTQQSRHQD